MSGYPYFLSIPLHPIIVEDAHHKNNYNNRKSQGIKKTSIEIIDAGFFG